MIKKKPIKPVNQMNSIYKKWVSIHKKMEEIFTNKKFEGASGLASALQTNLNEIINNIKETNSNNTEDESLLPSIINTVRRTLYPNDTKKQNDYELFTKFLPHATGVEGFDNPFEVEFAAILSTTINEINKNANSNISTTPSSFVAAQSSYKTVKPKRSELEQLLQNKIKEQKNIILKKLTQSSEIYDMKKEGDISGGKSDIFIKWNEEWGNFSNESTISTEIPKCVRDFMHTLYEINEKHIPLSFSLKQYAEPKISFGHSKFYTSLYLPILNLQISNLQNQSRIDLFLYRSLTYGTDTDNNDNNIDNKQEMIMNHMYHVRAIYEITGFGQQNKNNNSSSQAYFLCILTKGDNPARVIFMNDIIKDILNKNYKNIAIETTKSFSKDKYTISQNNDEKLLV